MPKRPAARSAARQSRSRRRTAEGDDSEPSPAPRVAESDVSELPAINDESANANGPVASGSSQVERTRARFLSIARDRAAHFAHFSAEDAEEPDPVASGNTNRVPETDQLEAAEEERDWPGPYETAKKLVEGRAAAAEARSRAQRADGKEKSDPVGKIDIPWRPKWEINEALKNQPSSGGGGGGREGGGGGGEEGREGEETVPPGDAGSAGNGGKHRSRIGSDGGVVRRQLSRLYDLCLAVVSANAGEVESLDGVPDAIRRDLSRSMSVRRAVDGRMLRLLLAGVSRELVVADCSLASEDDLREALSTCDRERLEVLDLGMCGRCLSDKVLSSTIAAAPSSLPSLSTASFSGAFRLSDPSLSSLTLAAPSLSSLALRHCPLLSSSAFHEVARNVGGSLRSLSLDGCCQLDAGDLTAALLAMPQLASLSLRGVQGLQDCHVSSVVERVGPGLRDLSLAQCSRLTDASVTSIASHAPSLTSLDLSHLPLLSDRSLDSLAASHPPLASLNVDRNKFSDSALADLVSLTGASLRQLSLNAVTKAGNAVLLALGRYAHANLTDLDVSWCRAMSNEGLGFVADSCTRLRRMRIYGCSQVNRVFVAGHSNAQLQLIGHMGTVLQ